MKNNKEPASTGNTSELFGTASSKSKNSTITLFDAIKDFQATLQDNDLGCPAINADKGIQRFKLGSEKGSSKSGWYIFYTNENNFAGAYGNWKTGLNETWHFSKNSAPLSIEERRQLKQIYNDAKKKQLAKKERQYAKARRIANSVWNNGSPASPNHPYLIKKHCTAASKSLKQAKENLLVPLYNKKRLVSIQYINKHGGKFFAKGGQLKGSYFMFGSVRKSFNSVYICEGISTGWTVHILSNYTPVFCAMTANNLKAVALGVRKRWFDVQIIICADNDVRQESSTTPNTGVEEALKAALAVNGVVSIPNMPDGCKCDFNDLYVLAVESRNRDNLGHSNI